MVFQIEQKTKLPLFSWAHKSLDFNISTKNFLPNFITQRCLMIKHNSKLNFFLVKCTSMELDRCVFFSVYGIYEVNRIHNHVDVCRSVC